MRQRPYRQDRSPFREQEEPYYPLPGRSDLTMLEEENAVLKLKCVKVSELQEKVQLVLKQNAQLLSENQKMARILHQLRSENQTLKIKNEGLYTQKNTFMSQIQSERRILIQEKERAKDQLAELEIIKNNQINELKNTHQLEIQTLKRSIQHSESSFDTELRKHRDLLDKKEHEVNEYAHKLKRITTETDYEILKLKEDKEKLKAEQAYMETDHAKEIENLRHKLENNYLEELEALKRAHVNALEEAERENSRVRDHLHEKTHQLEQVNSKYVKQKQVSEDNIHFLKKDNEVLRNKILQTEQMGHYQLANLKERLNHLHESEIEELVAKQSFQIQKLQEEIQRLENVGAQKSNDIEQLMKDKLTNRNLFDAELGRVKDDYALVLQKCKDQEIKLSEQSSQAAARLNDREKHIEYLEGLLKDQKNNSESQIGSLQKALDAIRQDLNNQKRMFKEKEQAYKEESSDLKHQLEDLKLRYDQMESDLNRKINDLKDQLNGTSANLSSRADSLQMKNRALEKENQALKNSLAQREKQIKALTERLKAAGERESKLEAQIDDLRNKLIKREQKSNNNINEQKSRLEASYANALESMKSDHQAAMRLEASKIRDLQEKLKKKDIELEQLLKMYKKMTEDFQVLTEQEANKKDITLKFPGATADLIATKNLFDVYLKTKVLDVCGDALKENPKKG